MMDANDDLLTLANGDIVMWIDSGAMHIKCVTKFGDPVELNMEEIDELIKKLQECLSRMS
jgi:hypothetical protein